MSTHNSRGMPISLFESVCLNLSTKVGCLVKLGNAYHTYHSVLSEVKHSNQHAILTLAQVSRKQRFGPGRFMDCSDMVLTITPETQFEIMYNGDVVYIAWTSLMHAYINHEHTLDSVYT